MYHILVKFLVIPVMFPVKESDVAVKFMFILLLVNKSYHCELKTCFTLSCHPSIKPESTKIQIPVFVFILF